MSNIHVQRWALCCTILNHAPEAETSEMLKLNNQSPLSNVWGPGHNEELYLKKKCRPIKEGWFGLHIHMNMQKHMQTHIHTHAHNLFSHMKPLHDSSYLKPISIPPLPTSKLFEHNIIYCRIMNRCLQEYVPF